MNFKKEEKTNILIPLLIILFLSVMFLWNRISIMRLLENIVDNQYYIIDMLAEEEIPEGKMSLLIRNNNDHN